MGEALGKIVEALLEVFKKNYKRPRLWISLLVVIFCVILFFPYIESNFFYFSRMEKRIAILEKVMELDENKINSNPVFKYEYESILQEIEQQKETSINSVMDKTLSWMSDSLSNWKKPGEGLIKFLTGALWFILVTIMVPFMDTFKGQGDKVLAFIMMLIISFVVGWVCSVLPTLGSIWINYVGIPVVQLIIVIIVLIRSKKK